TQTQLAAGPSTTPTVQTTETPSSTNTATASNTPQPTHTPVPTETPRPTSTPAPTDTPLPTSTDTATPAPIALTGKGDAVVDISKPHGAALAHIKYGGGGNFAITNYGPNGERINLLVNTIGQYEGTRPLDFLDGEQTARFEVNASGPWEIDVLPF